MKGIKKEKDEAKGCDSSCSAKGQIASCACCGEVGENEGGEELSLKRPVFIAGSVMFALGLFLEYGGFAPDRRIIFVVFAAAWLCVAKETLLTAWKNILRGQVFDENFLMIIAGVGAFCIGEYPEAVAVILFYSVGEYVQGTAVRRSKKSISKLMDIRPDVANLKIGGEVREVAAESVKIGDSVIVRPGEKIPLDGVISEGSSALDVRALTGESLPKEVRAGDTVLSGSVNGRGLLQITVTKVFSESTASKIISLVEGAAEKKAKTENFITTFAKYYTPAVTGAALLLAVIPPALGMGPFSDWLYRALVFLVISCPCALVISIPLGFFGGIGAASSIGILVKGGNCLEALSRVDTVVFDKTGTLTKGNFHVSEIIAAEGFTREQVLRYGAFAEHHSTHPIAVSIAGAYAERDREGIRESEIADMVEKAGRGVVVKAAGHSILAGNARLMREEGIETPAAGSDGTPVFIAVDGVFAGVIVISDEIKQDSKVAVEALRRRGVSDIVMLTGDNANIAEKIGGILGFDSVKAELLPHQKIEELEEIFNRKKSFGGRRKNGRVIFVGDGINDAPVLARADIGFAMGGVGSDAAIEAADVVIMNDEPSKVAAAMDIARYTKKIVWENIGLALGVKALVMILAAFGVAAMWEAVFADVGVAVLAALNAVRAASAPRRGSLV
jgi:Cd2+/Zn2+-exporting ATPase